MKYTTFGKTGLRVSRIALGGMPFGAVHNAAGWNPFAEDGQSIATRTVHAALAAGINYIDTAPSYGYGAPENFGNSERIIGKALEGRRDSCSIATKVGHTMSKAETIAGVEASLKRLRTDHVEVLQFHGGSYSRAEMDHILNEGPMEALQELREQGKARWLGFTAEQADTALPLIETGLFDMVQVRYNIIFQGISSGAIEAATKRGMGITVMRPMASGQFARIVEALEPRWVAAADPYDVALKFVLSDSRIHMANVGMRFPEEVARNARIVGEFEPTLDIATLPRTMIGFYEEDDKRHPAATH